MDDSLPAWDKHTLRKRYFQLPNLPIWAFNASDTDRDSHKLDFATRRLSHSSRGFHYAGAYNVSAIR
jgi:hypothetical protein